MLVSRLAGLVCLLAISVVPICAQQTSSQPMSDPQAIAFLQKAIAALTGSVTLTDVTLNGTATVTRSGGLASPTGQSTETDTVTLVALASGQSQITSVTPFGTKTTTQSISGGTPTLTMGGAGGGSQVIQTSTAQTPYPTWFFPAFLFSAGITSSYVASYVGLETWQGTAVQHIAIWRAGVPATEHDVYLDSSSFLPVAITYLSYPYNQSNPAASIVPFRGDTQARLTQIQFGNYQRTQGVVVAFDVKTLTKVYPFDSTSDLVSDLQISSVTFNTGATITAD